MSSKYEGHTPVGWPGHEPGKPWTLGDSRPQANHGPDAPDLLKQRDALLPLAERVSKLNPDAGEIGEGMLRQLVEEANAALAICDEQEVGHAR